MSSELTRMKACIVGMGARTAVGLRAGPAAMAVHAGISRIREHPYMIDKGGKPFMVAMDRTCDAHDRHERMHHLARSVLVEVLELLPDSRVVVPVLLALPELGAHYEQRHADALCRRLAAELADRARLQIAAMTEGNAAGLVAMERAVHGIAGGRFECCIVAGVDSWIDPDVLEGLDAAGRVTSESNRWGFPPGEGAGALLVCHPGLARRLRWPILGWVASVAVAHEPAAMGSTAICVGQGLAAAFRGATAGLGAAVTRQYCDIDGERYREHEFSYAILRVPGTTFENAIDYVAPHDAWGQVGAASAPLLTCLPLVTHARGFSPGAWPMVWCGSESGRRAAMVLHLEPPPQRTR